MDLIHKSVGSILLLFTSGVIQGSDVCKQKTFENGSDLCVGAILAPGPETQLKLKLKRRIHLGFCRLHTKGK